MIKLRYQLIRYTTKPFLFLFCIATVVLIGALRLLIGPEYALSLFYLFPIILTTWYVALWTGLTLSVVCALSWLISDLFMIERFSSFIVPFINQTFRLIVFIMVSILISKIKKILENQKRLARIDPLTQIANRRAFYEFVDLEIKKARRISQPITIIYIDLDNFKVINDRLGHSTGDKLLCGVARCIKENLRDTDLVARLGGDEFCVLLAGASEDAAYQVASKINNILLEFMARQKWPVTFSIGVVTCNSIPASVDEPIQQAEELMYQAKKKGSDKIQQVIISDH